MAAHPNILWIQCDEIRADALSCYGGNHWIRPQTPNVQRLADEGVVFDSMFCPSPVCMPSRGCEYTSQHATTLGVYHNVTRRLRGRTRFDTSWPTWPAALRQAGYRAVNVGKLHVVDYDIWDESGGGAQYPSPDRLAAEPPPDLGLVVLPGINLIIGGTYPLADGTDEGFGARRLTRLGLQRLAELQAGSQPWLLRLSYVAPHTPVLAPPPFDRLYPESACAFDPDRDTAVAGMSAYERSVVATQESRSLSPAQVARARATYYGLVSAIDREIGMLLDHVPPETIVVLTGDHGTMLGEMGLWQKQIFNRKVHQVPYVIRAPGLPPARRTDAADLLDSGPTLLSLCGLPPCPGSAGRDLFAPDCQPKDIFAAFGFGDDGAFMYEALDRGPGCPRRICIRSGPWRLDLSIRRHGRILGPAEYDTFFCDTREDPEERRNAAGEARFSGIVSELTDRLVAWHRDTAAATAVES